VADTPAWSDPATWVGAGGLLAIAGSSAKALLDWRKDKGQQRATSEDMVRDDLLATIRDQRVELGQMRTELSAARIEMREQDARSREAVRACEERADKFLEELRKLHSENDMLRSRHHRFVNYFSVVREEVDTDRLERGLKPLPLPSWIDETIPGPTARMKPPEPPA